jgi:hypothetical protein
MVRNLLRFAGCITRCNALRLLLNPFPVGFLNEESHDRTASAAEIRVEQFSSPEDRRSLIDKANATGVGDLAQPQSFDYITTAAVGALCRGLLTVHVTLPLHNEWIIRRVDVRFFQVIVFPIIKGAVGNLSF